MKQTITQQLRNLGLTDKQIKRINNYVIHSGGYFKFANLSHVEFYTWNDGTTLLHLFHKDENYGFLGLEKEYVLAK